MHKIVVRAAIAAGWIAAHAPAAAMKGTVERTDPTGVPPAAQTGVVEQVDAAGRTLRIQGVEYELVAPRGQPGRPAQRGVRAGDSVRFVTEPGADRLRILELTVEKP